MLSELRESLQKPEHRTRTAIISGIITAVVAGGCILSFIHQPWNPPDIRTINPEPIIRILQLSSILCTIISALILVIRNRSIDIYLKYHEKGICTHDPIKTGQNLTNILLLSITTAVMQYVFSAFIYDEIWSIYVFSIPCFSLMAASVTQYIYALFALELLEKITIQSEKKTTENTIIPNTPSQNASFPEEWKSPSPAAHRP